MQKKVMAVAVAGALGALAVPSAAFAQASTVQIGGSIHLIYAISRPHNALPTNAVGTAAGPNHDQLQTSEPELFVRGEENIGGANAVWFQCTSTFDVIGTATEAGTGEGWCGRNSAIGFKGNWGNVFFGNWDNPHKLTITPIRGWWGLNNVYAGAGRMLWNAPASDAGNSGASFSRRTPRSINYHSPSWGGFAFRANYTAQNESTALATQPYPAKPRGWSVDANYNNGPLIVGIGYERHKNMNPGGVAIGVTPGTYGSGLTDNNWVIVGSYTIGGFLRLGAVYTRSKYENTNSTTLSKNGWWLIADWTIAGPHSLKVNYAQTGDSKGTSTLAVGSHQAPLGAAALAGLGTGGKVFGINYAYEFSKRTTGYVGYNRVSNDAGARYSLGYQGNSLGQSQTMYGLGMRHRF